LYASATEVLTAADLFARDGSVPMVHYTLAYVYEQAGEQANAATERQHARMAAPDRCFPYRIEELLVLQSAVDADPGDARAFYYMGNWLYGRQRREQALDCWEIATRLETALATAWRNLGFGLFNVRHDIENAVAAYNAAFTADPGDARVFYERDQLWKRTGTSTQQRFAEFEKHPEVVRQRDDLALELAALYNRLGEPERALEVLQSRRFQPWEGGEGLVLAQYERTKISLGRKALAANEPTRALDYFTAALHSPENLGEARHPLASTAEVYFWMGEAAAASGNVDEAISYWQRAGADKRLSEQTLYTGLALARLGERRESRNLLRQLWFFGRKLAREKAEIDYFATSLPALLLFEDDLTKSARVRGLFLQTQARLGLGQLKLAKRSLEQLLRLEANHDGAADLAAKFPI
jgi:tetratricopeptide (TPR) repeat protein